jgi:predicted nucleic acid-binding protein
MIRIYLDSAPVIYLVERVEPYYAALQTAIHWDDLLVVSHLTRMECRILPMRTGDRQLLAEYDAFFASQIREIALLDARVMDKATEIRALYRFGIADSIHLAAVVSGCEVFLTNDLRLTHFSEIVVRTL